MNRIVKLIRRIVEHPLTRGMDIDDPSTTILRRRIIASKPFLKHLYMEWYGLIRASLPIGEGPILEVGSGAGFLQHQIPRLITSDLIDSTHLQIILDAHHLPFSASSLQAIVMVNVLHHFSNPELFFGEAQRVTKKSGRVIMIEPWASSFSRLIYKNLHHEPFESKSASWNISKDGALSAANSALPWVIFSRDRSQFEAKFSSWRIKRIEPMMPFCYLLSGGVSMRAILPGLFYPIVRGFERLLDPWIDHWAMFALIILERVRGASGPEHENDGLAY